MNKKKIGATVLLRIHCAYAYVKKASNPNVLAR
jgi:hypothetical protein